MVHQYHVVPAGVELHPEGRLQVRAPRQVVHGAAVLVLPHVGGRSEPDGSTGGYGGGEIRGFVDFELPNSPWTAANLLLVVAQQLGKIKELKK